jgi:group I intron endonuclease
MDNILNKKYHFVYLTVNKINGKCYVGSHSTNDINDNYFGSGVALKESISKYSKNNFIRIILKYFDNYIDSRNTEKIYIDKFDTLSPNGYNICPIGGMQKGICCHSEETKEKIGLKHKGKKLSEETKEKIKLSKENISEETRKKIGLSSKNRSSESNYKCGSTNRGKITWMKGKNHTKESNELNRQKHLGKKVSDETKNKLSISNSGENNPMYKKSFYDVWVEKYGKEIADNKYINWKTNLKNNKNKNGNNR